MVSGIKDEKSIKSWDNYGLLKKLPVHKKKAKEACMDSAGLFLKLMFWGESSPSHLNDEFYGIRTYLPINSCVQ
jgi:hypothetical protein